ncbi:MAG: hypothetical protein NT031_15555 [Planctomycetota bacterium]|nr:hypothetical protein [Planctomycetota bacterium]
MTRIAGIDEAGFGPVLGPLVVSTACLDVPDQRADTCLWDLLRGCVAKSPGKRRGGAVVVADSKKVYDRKKEDGLQHLERAVLGMLATRDRRPANLGELLKCLAPEAPAQAAMEPWHADCTAAVPACISPTDLALAGNVLAAGLAGAGVQLAAMRAECLFVPAYNRLVRATRNKSTTLLDTTCRLLVYLWGKHPGPGQTMRIYVDRQGGRQHYRPTLQRTFEGFDVAVTEETETRSRYRLASEGKVVEIHFTVGGEDDCLLVALASMMSKYLRELLMAGFNRFWASHVPGLAPTAGYYVDGLRFHREITPAAEKLGVDPSVLLRCK